MDKTKRDGFERELLENIKAIADELQSMRKFFEYHYNAESTAAVLEEVGGDISDGLSIIAEYITYLSTQGQTPKHQTKQFVCSNQRDEYIEPDVLRGKSNENRENI